MSQRRMLLLVVLGVCLAASAAHSATLKVNFQQRGGEVPEGYLPDYGQPFGPQESGFSYGWDRSIEGDARNRGSANAQDERYDTLNHLQKSGDAIWEIELADGPYEVFMVCGDPDNTNQTNNFDVEGVVVEDPDGQDNFDEYEFAVEVADGRLTVMPAAGASNCKIMFIDITGEGFDELLGKAKSPTPADGADNVAFGLFEWTPGVGVFFNNVYLGASPELTDADLVSPNYPMSVYFHAQGLTPGTTYYWRVDGMTADMLTTYTGDVWTFSVPPQEAWGPTPAPDTPFVNPGATLSWRPGLNAFSHDVYLGTNPDEVAAGTGDTLQGNQAEATYATGMLDAGMTYHWRVDEVKADGTKLVGAVWSFTTIPLIDVTDPDLLAWWKMDERVGITAVDWSGSGRHATFGDPAPAWASGQLGGALGFAGSGDQAVHDDASFLNGLDAVTIMAWIKSNVTNTDKGYIIFETPSGADNHDMRYDAAGATAGGTNLQKVGLTVQVDETTQEIVQLESSNDSQSADWQHVALVWSSGQPLEFYINGVLDVPTGPADAVTGTLAGFQTVIIGKGGKDTGGSWDGLIDEVRIYGKALTPDEIALAMRGDLRLAWDPQPSRGALVDIRDAGSLAWSAGNTAAQHDVYFGTDEAVVAGADAASPEYQGRQAGTDFSLAGLVEIGGGDYFWRIDEVEADGATVHKGSVWSFTIPNFLVVDTFEQYTNESPNRIFQSWVDGLGFSEDEFFPGGNPGNGSGAIVGHDIWSQDSPYFEGDLVETSAVNSGRQAMPLYYDNSSTPYYSEAERTFATPQNWTVEGVTDLTVHFRGSPAALIETAPGAFTMGGAGADIWGTADDFTFTYAQLNGNGSIVARVDSIVERDVWTKVGVMIRNGLEPESINAFAYVTPNGRVGWQYRSGTGGDSSSTRSDPGAITLPHWLRLTRTGNTITAEHSVDGLVWEPMLEVANPDEPTERDFALPATVFVGLAVTSHSASNITTAEFSNVQTSGMAGALEFAEIGSDHPLNAADGVYIRVQDSAGHTATAAYPEVNATLVDEWTAWRIPLTDFSGAGVNLAAITKMSLGVGEAGNPMPTGAGLLLVDDILVTLPDPVAELGDAAAE